MNIKKRFKMQIKNLDPKQKKKLLIISLVIIIFAVIVTLVTKKIIYEVNKTIEETAAQAASEAYEQAYQAATAATTSADQEQEVHSLMDDGYLPLNDCMTLAGYSQSEITPSRYAKTIASIPVDVVFNFAADICHKNEYDFDLTNMLYTLRDVTYIRKECISAITNYDFELDEDYNISAVPVDDTYDYSAHEWTACQLIAHAGGGYRDTYGGFYSYYTNSYDALVQNYNLGARIFEFDFSLTSDGRLAAVHDWNDFGNMDGQPMSSEEWAETATVAKPLTDRTFTSMFIEDILDQMMVNQDMYLITDVKYDNSTQEEFEHEFSAIYQAAMDRDPMLINRIVPQVYSEETYDWIMDVYNFPSVIFTCYKTEADADEIISFCSSKDNIHVITAKYQDKRFDEDAVASIHENGMLFYNYTVSTFTKMYDGLAKGVDGIYSNTLLPQDFDVYYISKKH